MEGRVVCVLVLMLRLHIVNAGVINLHGTDDASEIGVRLDNLIQVCHGHMLKHTFPDFDYALRGYNILKGYPRARGHDPGLTYPIFKADYSDLLHTADCRYRVPSGFIIAPDVSCVTSFESEELTNSKEHY